MADGNALTSVYQYFDKAGQLLYVGVTARGTRRAVEHAETKVWWPLATGCVLEHFLSREEALEREKDLIQKYAPPYNTVHNANREAARDHYEAHAPRHAEGVPVHGIKERRAAWYAMDPAERALTPCVRCQQRPGTNGPECLVCRPARSKVARIGLAESA